MKSFYSTLKFSVKTGFVALVAVVFLGIGALNAQVTGYTFSSTSGTYTPITGGTVLGAATNDDNIFANNPIGFSFCYNGVTYTSFGLNANGWLYFGSATGASSYTAISSGTTNNVVAAFNFDIQGEAVTGDLRYQTIGSAPNRTLVLQWTNYDAWPSGTNTDTYNFQIRLNETTNVIDIVYGSYTLNAFRLAQVGLRGNNNADFNNREVTNGINTWATSTPGAFNTSTCEANNTGLIPSSGQTYTWTPPTPPVAPINMTFTGVSSSGMTVNWDDNSTNESNFIVYRSLDNVVFTQVAVVPSTSTATTGTPYNYVATGLFTNTLYYWRVEAVNAGCAGGYLAGQQSTSPGTLCGTYTIGPTGAYTSLTAAVAAVAANGILCPLIFEFQAAYVSTVETFPINIPFLGSGPATNITCRPELGATNIVITSNAAQTINFTGSSYFMFDGRPGGVGVNRELSIENTSTAGNAIQFVNDAQSSGATYCNIRGVNTSTVSGVVSFGAAVVGGIGNSNNSFTNNNFTSGATRAVHLVYASNPTANVFSINNTFNNNNFFDYGTGTLASSALTVTGGNSAWVITNNSFYQTATRSFTSAVTHWGINIAATTAGTGAFNISGNFVGGSAANCGGSAWTDNATVAQRFIAINVTTGNGGVANSIQGNLITNFVHTTSSGITTSNGIWCGIFTTGTGASHNIGTITGNTVGSPTATGVIMTTTSGTGGMTAGICNIASGAINISNNMVGGITALTTAGTISSSINGINTTTGINTISANIVGSTTTASSLINAPSTGATSGQITGIFCSASTAGNTTSGNTVMNITSQYAGTSTLATVKGIVVTTGQWSITGNTIGALTSLTNGSGVTTGAAVTGIAFQSVSAFGIQNVSANMISGLAAVGTTGNQQVNGILVTSSTTTGFTYQVHGNSISALGAPMTSGTSVTNGIHVYGGVGRVYNNMVVLGLDVMGAPVTQNKEYNGIYKNTANRSTVCFNSVSIDGAGVAAGTANTYGYRRLFSPAAAPVDSVYSNIFSNTRSNGTGTGTHYAIGLNNFTNFSANANNYYGNGTGYMMGFDGAVSHATVSAWTSATGQDVASFGVNPMFTSATNLHINNPGPTPLESRAIAMGVNIDYDTQVRPGPVGSVNGGGTVPDIGADEFDGFPVNVDVGAQLLILPATTGCHGAADTVRVRVKNYSTVTLDMSINNVIVNASVTGPNPQSFGPITLNSGTLAGGATIDVTMVTNYNMSAAGTYVFNASATQTSDIVNSNDAMGAVSINVSGGTFVANAGGELCLGDSTGISVTGYTNGGTIQWQSSPDNVTWTNIAGATTTPFTVTPSDTTFYRAMICGLHISTVDTLFPEFVATPTTTNDTICGNGTLNLTASASGTIRWYDAPTGGNMVASGATYSPALSVTDTFYVENSSGTPPTVFTTTFAAGNGSSGNCFTVKALSTITITSFDGHLSSPIGTPSSWEIWYRPNDYLLSPGSHLSSAGWTQLGTGTVNSAGPGQPTPIPVALSLVIPAGQTYSFQIFTTTGAVSYSNGTMLGALYSANADLEFYQGHGGTAFAGMVNQPRVFNGNIHYSSGCASTRAISIGVVIPAPVVSVSSSNNICGSGSSTLIASSTNPNYDYAWTPTATLNQSTGDTVIASPSTGTTYLVTGVDTATGCTDSASVFVGWYMNPVGTATVSSDTVCVGDSVALDVTVPSNIVTIGANQAQNTTTTYPAPYGNWYWGARHQFLVTAADLTAAGLVAGPIDALTFQVLTLTATALDNFTISMGHTTVGSLTAFLTTPMTTVYTNASYTPILGLNQHVFQTMFFWNGVDNIVIETCHNNTSFTNNCVFALTNTAYNSSIYYRADAAGVCSNPAITGIATQRPRLQMRRAASNNYSWTPAPLMNNATIQNPMAMVPANTDFIVTILDSMSGCLIMDTVSVVTLPTPNPMFGPDTVICSNTALLLDGTFGTDYVYIWQDSSTAQTFSVNAFGNYYVEVTDTSNGCIGTDTILVGVNAAPSFTLGADAVVCSGTQVSFSGPSGQYDYLWNTGDTVVTITTGTGGSYDVLVTDTVNGCAESDTVMLTVNPNPPVALGSDTSVCSASGSLTLMGPAGAYDYNWSTGDSTQTIMVNSTGVYSVLVTDTATTCYSSDTITVNYNTSPVAALGNDTTFCSANGPITLAGPAGPYNYMWSDMSTGMTLQTNTTGTYYVDVTDTTSGCTATDTIMINVPMSPAVSLTDTSLCGTQHTIMGPAGPYNYLWSDMTTGMNNTVTSSGTYGLTVTDTTSGCAGMDSAVINLNSSPTVTATASSMTPCADDANVMLTGSPAGGMFFGTSVTGNQFDPSVGAGTYAIIYNYTDVNGCSGADTISIVVNACVGITEPFVQAGMNVYPNPNNGVFTFTAADVNCEKMTIEVMTLEGQVVRAEQHNNIQGNFVTEIDMDEFANGTYLMRVITDGAVYTQRIVKQD